MTEDRAQWGNKIEFILTVIGFAVGLGAVWRFPYLVFTNGGGTFIIIFFFMLFIVGIPLFFLELSIGQFSGLGPTHAFYRLAPIFQGLGYAGLSISAFIGFYYNMIIAYCLYYAIMSFRSKLPWGTCGNEWNTPQCNIRNSTLNCTQFHELFPNPKSPSEEYFYRKVLNLSESIGNLGKLEIHLVLSLLFSWAVVFIVLSKGIQSLGKVSYFTATFPYVMLTILVITGGLLEGSGEGIKFYIGSADVSKFYSPGVWKDATVQIFYALSTCQGGLIAMSSMNNFKNNILRDTFLIPILDCLTGLYGGFAIFTVLGYMFVSKCAIKFQDVVAAGPELAFIVYPEGLSLMKAVPPLWSILFFLMMLALGFGSEFSYMETIMIMITDMFKNTINTKLKIIIMRFTVCLVFFLFGLSMTSQGGFFILSLLNEYTAGYPLLIVGLLEVIVVPWIYGTERLIADIETMIGKKPSWFWIIWKILWKFVCPIAILLVIVATAVFGSNELVVNNIKFPAWAHAIGYIVSAIPILIIIGCAIMQSIKYNFNWKELFSPDEAYYANYKKNISNDETNENNNKIDFKIRYDGTRNLTYVEEF